MKIVRYQVRVLDKEGTVTFRKTFKVESAALERVRRARERGKRAILRKKVIEGFVIRTGWGNTTSRPTAGKPLKILVGHHSVTKQLSPNATVKQEKAEMRNIQAIGYARDLGGFPYGHAIFPSGRCYRGSGFGVVEAATGGHNTDTDSVVFVGNYETFEPTDAQLDTFVKLARWARTNGFYGKTIEVAPHQRYKATACPGRHIIAKLDGLERRINK